VLAVDLGQRRVLLETNGRTVELGAEFLDDRTEHGDPTLVHGYAITCHVAQGLTTDRAFVLAEEGASRELGYTALSRGRHGNYLYLTREPDDARAEYAPTQTETREPMQRLITALKTSTANTLAIDIDPAALVADAAHRHTTAVAQRHALEQSGWKPRRRRLLEGALERERKVARMLAHAKRTSAEVTHGRKPFVTEQDLAGGGRTPLGPARRAATATKPRARRRPRARAMSDSWLSELMTATQIADLLQMKRSTVDDYARRGVLPPSNSADTGGS